MIIAAFNPKGGVGKTTMAVTVSTVLAARGQAVLLVDLEADFGASISLGVRPAEVSPSMAEVLRHEIRPEAAVREVAGVPGLHLITGAPALAEIDRALRNVRQPERRLGDALRPLTSRFDVIMLDCPAGFSIVPESVGLAADFLVVPIRADYLSLESLAQFLRRYRDRHAARRATAQVAGILLTMIDYRRLATREIVDIIRMHNKRGVFRTEIPADPRVCESPSHGVPLPLYAPRSRAAAAFRRFTTELMRRVRA